MRAVSMTGEGLQLPFLYSCFSIGARYLPLAFARSAANSSAVHWLPS